MKNIFSSSSKLQSLLSTFKSWGFDSDTAAIASSVSGIDLELLAGQHQCGDTADVTTPPGNRAQVAPGVGLDMSIAQAVGNTRDAVPNADRVDGLRGNASECCSQNCSSEKGESLNSISMGCLLTLQLVQRASVNLPSLDSCFAKGLEVLARGHIVIDS